MVAPAIVTTVFGPFFVYFCFGDLVVYGRRGWWGFLVVESGESFFESSCFGVEKVRDARL